MAAQSEAAVVMTQRSRVRRHCSTICIALVVARFTPAITLARPALPDATPAALSAAPAAPMLHLVAHFCLSEERCGSLTATISVASRDTRDTMQ